MVLRMRPDRTLVRDCCRSVFQLAGDDAAKILFDGLARGWLIDDGIIAQNVTIPL